MKSRKKIIVVAVTAVLTAALFWIWHDRNVTDSSLVLYGNVDIREVELAFRQPGRLLSMKVDEGDIVTKGDVLAELDAQPYRDSLAAAEAEVLRATAERDKLRAGNRPQEIQAAAEAVREAEAVLLQREADLKRQAELVARGDASKKTLEAARMSRDVASASLASAKQVLSLQQEGFRAEDIAAAEAQLAAAEASRAQARTALEDTMLIAPSDATVMSRVREPGSMVGSQSAVYTLSLRDPIYVRAYVGETALGKIAQGGKVLIRTDSTDKAYHGQIGFISPRAEFTPKSVETTDLRTDLVYRLRITVTDGDDALKQGMPVTITLDGGA